MTTRDQVVAEAMSWLGTPFHHEARLKGVGVDCANLLIGVFAAVGMVEPIALEHYAHDWHLHQDDPKFMRYLLQHADPLPPGEPPLPGDIAMFRYGRQAAHGAIVTAWPVVVHAWLEVGAVTLTEADRGQLGSRLAGLYRIRGL